MKIQVNRTRNIYEKKEFELDFPIYRKEKSKIEAGVTIYSKIDCKIISGLYHPNIESFFETCIKIGCIFPNNIDTIYKVDIETFNFSFDHHNDMYINGEYEYALLESEFIDMMVIGKNFMDKVFAEIKGDLK
jgi:DNA-binding XRE family transcriptional regulator